MLPNYPINATVTVVENPLNVTVSNVPVFQTGTSVSTGILLNVFYPLNSNPSGYITSGQTGQFQTSLFGVVFQTGNQIISGLKDFSSGIAVSFISGDSNYQGMIDSNGIVSIDWTSRVLEDGGQVQSLDWNARILKDAFQNYSIQYSDRFLRDAAQNYVLDWNNKILSGNWTAQSLSVSGQSVVTINNLSATGAIFAAYTGNILNFITGISPTGFDNYAISFPKNFSSVPKVNCTLENTGLYLYSFEISNRTTSGFAIYFSDMIVENGMFLNISATIN
jgi:hypothetical protein